MRNGFHEAGGDSRTPGRFGYGRRMSERASTPVPVPPKSPEREAEIRELLERASNGDLSGLIPWEEVAVDLGLPVASSSPHRSKPNSATLRPSSKAMSPASSPPCASTRQPTAASVFLDIIEGERYRTIIFPGGRGSLDYQVFDDQRLIVLVDLTWV